MKKNLGLMARNQWELATGSFVQMCRCIKQSKIKSHGKNTNRPQFSPNRENVCFVLQILSIRFVKGLLKLSKQCAGWPNGQIQNL